MENSLCDICGSEYEKQVYTIKYPEISFSKDTDCLVCEKCDKAIFDDSECYAVYAAAKMSGTLSLNAIKMLIVCIKYLNYNTYLCANGNDCALQSEELMEEAGLDKTRFILAEEELWKERLVLKIVRGNDNKSFYFVNGFNLGMEDSQQRFISKGLFFYQFFTNSTNREVSRRRALRKSNLVDDLTNDEREEIFNYFGNRCALTGKEVPLQLDHVIPLAVGHGGTTKRNMIPIWQRINSSKGAKNIFEWYRSNGQRFGCDPDRFNEVIQYLAKLNGMTTEEYHSYVYECHSNPNDIVAKGSL